MRSGLRLCAWGVALLVLGCVPRLPPSDCAPPGEGRLVVPTDLAGDARCIVEEVSPETFLRADTGGLLPFDIVGVRRTTCVDPGSGNPLAVAEEISFGSPLEAWAADAAAGPGTMPRTGCRLIRVRAGGETDAASRVEQALIGQARALAGSARLPAEVEALKGSFPGARVSYERLAVAGLRPLAPAAVAVPAAGTPTTVAFVSLRESSAEALAAFDRIVLDHTTGSRGAAFTLGVGDASVTLWDERLGWVNLVRDGRWLCGMIGLPGAADGWSFLPGVISRLRQADRR